ncbi:MAG: hypothetical protein AAGB29_04640 [Planctomycetota bacterium]
MSLGWTRHRWLAMAALLAVVVTAWGCESYQLRGKVVSGVSSSIEVVGRDDERLAGPGIAGARVEGWIDPDRLDRERLPTRSTDADGEFALPVTATGAGLLEYDVWLTASAVRRLSASTTIRLPGSDRRVLITLGPGDGRPINRYGDPLRETLELAEPYLND